MVEQLGLFARGQRHIGCAFLPVRHRRASMKARRVEHRLVAGRLDVAQRDMGQPEMRIGRMRAVGEAGAAAGRGATI